jgi:hypothetical protein
MYFLTALLALAAASESENECDDNVCLLSLRASSSVASEAPIAPRDGIKGWSARREALLEWTKNHAAVRAAATAAREKNRKQSPSTLEGTDELNMEQFIKQQQASSDSCHAKYVEVRRTLDGLHMKVDLFSKEVESNEAIISAHTDIMEEKSDQKKAAEEKYQEDIAECKRIRDEDYKEVEGYQAELDELTNIANPSVRSKIHFDVDYSQEAESHVDAMEEHLNATEGISDEQHAAIMDEVLSGEDESLLETKKTVHQWNLTHENCKVLSGMLQASSALKKGDPAWRELDCDAARETLQEQFTKAFAEITKLRDAKAQQVSDEYNDCVAMAEGIKDEAFERLDGSIADSTTNIMRAREIIHSIDPLLEDAKKALAMVQAHLGELEKSCEEEDDVSEHLQRIRDLILSLEKCPGRHDFTLKMPEGAMTS